MQPRWRSDIMAWQLTAVLEDGLRPHAIDGDRLELRALAGLGAEEELQLRLLLLERLDEEALAVPASTSQARQCWGVGVSLITVTVADLFLGV